MIITGCSVENVDNVIDLIVRDHNTVKTHYDKFKHTINSEEKGKICNQLIKELVQHDECEQLIVYPLLKSLFTKEAERYYKESLEDHQEMRNQLFEARHTKENKDFEAKLNKAMDIVLYHIDKEEKEVLSFMKRELKEETLKNAGSSFKDHKTRFRRAPYSDISTEDVTTAVASILTKPF
ncbi:MAG: hypothetical protein EXX96DRAFT_577021 [Benjaminiella poitrasii]|nr:MAG: hypothetical protein EXX96DRAFT_577021 [Benjaminiella poitrasii]